MHPLYEEAYDNSYYYDEYEGYACPLVVRLLAH